MKRVCAHIHGFHLYHAIDNLRDNRLKWLNLRLLIENFTKPDVHSIEKIYYFSAYATWKEQAYHRHLAYTKALKHTGIETVMGQFKEKDRACKKCGAKWKGHEEKETDVKIALQLLDDAYQDKYDTAIIVSQDSDLFPAIRLVKDRFPDNRSKSLHRPICGTVKKWQKLSAENSLGKFNKFTLNVRYFLKFYSVQITNQSCAVPENTVGNNTLHPVFGIYQSDFLSESVK